MKSSFTRRKPAAQRDPGTRPGPFGQTLVSTGLADFDALLGGGLPLGCLLVVLEDSPPDVAATLLRYFVAEGAACGHACRWTAPEGLPEAGLWLPAPTQPVAGTAPPLWCLGVGAALCATGATTSAQICPAAQAGTGVLQAPEQQRRQGGGEGQPAQQDHLRIAWQYRRYMGGRADAAHAPHPQQQQRQQSQPTPGSGAVAVVASPAAAAPAAAEGWCHSFDLGKQQPAASLGQLVELRRHSPGAGAARSACSAVADQAHTAASTAASGAPAIGASAVGSPSARAAVGPVVRIAVQSLGFCAGGGRVELAAEAAEAAEQRSSAAAATSLSMADAVAALNVSGPHMAPAEEATATLRAIHEVKRAVRDRRCAAMVTVQTDRFSPDCAVRLAHLADAVVKLEAIAPDAELLQIIPEPDTCRGMLRVVKLPGCGALAPPHPEVDLLLVRRLWRRLALQPVDVDPDAADALLEAQPGGDRAGADATDVQDDLDDDESDSLNTLGVGSGVAGGGMLCGGGRPAGAADPFDF